MEPRSHIPYGSALEVTIRETSSQGERPILYGQQEGSEAFLVLAGVDNVRSRLGPQRPTEKMINIDSASFLVLSPAPTPGKNPRLQMGME